MEVTVVLFATLMRYHPQGEKNKPITMELPEGATINDLIERLGIGENEAKQAFIRHKSRPFDYKLEEGDRVAIFPPVAGG